MPNKPANRTALGQWLCVHEYQREITIAVTPATEVNVLLSMVLDCAQNEWPL
ncbi:hypothetical protein [Nodosilinea sp. P-1105]|uniref:hypothetical protein n=1 Tax=Nodosilinea sp. P-1105 TaxID=2546229 RepID=UPI00146CF603|nr:hypothetical protein [Nodosilinea sp. P-1105]